MYVEQFIHRFLGLCFVWGRGEFFEKTFTNELSRVKLSGNLLCDSISFTRDSLLRTQLPNLSTTLVDSKVRRKKKSNDGKGNKTK